MAEQWHPPACPYCEQPAELVPGGAIYPSRAELHERWFWSCKPCGAHVGTHLRSKQHHPLGTLANAELRAARRRVHGTFDALWLRKQRVTGCTKSDARAAGYRWLAEELSIADAAKHCHIAMFDLETCAKAIHICTGVRR